MDNHTPLKEIHVPDQNSPCPKKDHITLNFSYKYLRNLKGVGEQNIIDKVNNSVEHVKLRQSDRLIDRLSVESYRLSSEYKKIKGGNNKSKFDLKQRSVLVYNNELEQLPMTPIPNTPTTPLTPSFENKGVRIDNASSAHKHRVVKKLENHTAKALDFVETYGVIPKKLVCESFTGEECTLNIDGLNTNCVGYDNMTKINQENVQQVTHLCDSAMISDTAYHELAIRFPQMPRKSHLTACRHELNTQFDIKRTPGMLPGSFLSIRSEIVKDVERRLEQNEQVPSKLQIKLSGDGAKVSRVSNFLVLSYSWIGLSDSHSHLNQRVIAIVNCCENYINLSKSLSPVFHEINEMNSEAELNVLDRSFELEFFVGGDMKFIQIMLGLNGSIANYACPWCKVPKETRGDIYLSHDHYHALSQFRTINELMCLAVTPGKQKYGVVHKPLLTIEPDHYIPDELHLLMRVTDVLLRNLIIDAQSKDEYAKIMGQPTDNVCLLVKAIQSCGVCFQTWTSKNGETDWTSLSGNDKKKVLNRLPDKLIFCLHDDTAEKVRTLWTSFRGVYKMIVDKARSDYDQQSVHKEIQQFMSQFLELGTLKRVKKRMMF